MTTVNLSEAKERLPELLDQVDKGEEVVITKGDGASYKITIVTSKVVARTKRTAGLGRGSVLYMCDDFDEDSPEINALSYGNE